MRLTGVTAIAACLVLVVFLAGCGDTFRPVVTPQTSSTPVPQVRTFAMVLSAEVPVGGLCTDLSVAPCTGYATQIDVPGDVDLNDFAIGRQSDPSAALTDPYPFVTAVKAAFVGQEIFALNPPDSTLSAYFPTLGTTFTNLVLPPGSYPLAPAVATYTLAGGTTATSKVYVAAYATNQVFVITAVNSLQTTLAVGVHPISITISADNTKAYVVNKGSNSVTAISTGDETVNPVNGANIAVGSAPIYAVTNTATGLIYVLNSDSTISTIDPATDTALATLTVPRGSPSGAAMMAYDAGLNRLYVPNKNNNTVTVYDASARNLVETTNSPLTVGTAPTVVAVLPDGSRAYVVNSGDITGCAPYNTANLGRVSMILGASNTVTACVSVGQNPTWISAASDGSKVYVVHKGSAIPDSSLVAPDSALAPAARRAPGTTIIRATNNAMVADIAAPSSNHEACVNDVTRAVCKWLVPFYTVNSK